MRVGILGYSCFLGYGMVSQDSLSWDAALNPGIRCPRMRSECPRIGYPRIVPASWDAVSWDTVSWDTPGYLRIAVSYLGILDSIPGYGVPGYGIPG